MDFITFDPELRSALEAQLSLERAHHLRTALVHWVAFLALFVWLAAIRPGWLEPATGRALLGGWGLSALAAVAATWREWRLRVRLRRSAV